MSAIPKTMKAIKLTETGDVGVINVTEIPVPTPGPTQVLFRNEWAGCNYLDIYFRAGIYPIPLPFILGAEGSGTIVSLGSELSTSTNETLKVGDRVSTFGLGSLAEYVAVERKEVALVPEGIDSRTAAAATLQGLTALTALREAYEIKKGDTVLVHAAAGGVGLHLCQMARHYGATVIGTVSTQAKAEIAKAHGADHVVLYGQSDYAAVPEQVLKITEGKGVNAIFDGIGAATWEGNFKSIARKGTIVSFGAASGPVAPFSPRELSAKNIKLVRPMLNSYCATPEETAHWSHELFQLISQGAVKVNVHQEYPFTTEGVRQGYTDLSSRSTTGKLIIKF